MELPIIIAIIASLAIIIFLIYRSSTSKKTIDKDEKKEITSQNDEVLLS
jgi:hypothetical protein